MYAYLIAALVVMVMVAGAGYKGYQLGGNAVRVEWDKANTAAAKQVEADRQAQESKARKLASRYEAKIATQNLANREITSALDKALAAKPLPPECVIDPILLDIWNRANRGESDAAGKLLDTSKPTTAAGKPIH